MTRVLILQKAYEMYLEGQLVHGDERLAAVLEELGYTTGAGYQIWANQAEFQSDLRVFIAENVEYTSLSTIADDLHALEAQGMGFDEFVLTGADKYFKRFLAGDGFYLSLRFFALDNTREPEVTQAIVDSYDRATRAVYELFTRNLQRYGLVLRESISMSDVAAMVTALVEGFALRARVESDQATAKVMIDGRAHYVFSMSLLALIQGLVEPAPTH